MKKNKAILVLLLLFTLTISLVACVKDGNDGDKTAGETQTSFVIQYTDDTGTFNISVEDGQPYAMSAVPYREGYVFVGLFDSEVGGTQYVNSKGSSVSVFTDKKNIVLFPRFEAKKFTVVLDYQGAAVNGAREIEVSYDAKIKDLPTGLYMKDKDFMGWYTQPNREGAQIADAYGVIPTMSLINSTNFDLSDPNGYIRLYAGFRGELHTVTFNFEENLPAEEIEVEHGTAISKVVTETRVNNKAVITWSKKPNDTAKESVFNGKVTEDMVLYACEYAPVIDFDANGGKDAASIVAKAGSAIQLPTPVRTNYVFAGWYTAGGARFNATTMPSDSVKLIAKWNPMIVFDERGGKEVKDISDVVGSKVTLPETEKDGYIFAGWYNEQGNIYTSTSMPANSIKLVAKYHKILTKKIVVIDNSKSRDSYALNPTMQYSDKIDLSDIYNAGARKIKMTARYSSKISIRNSYNPDLYTYMAYYSQNTASNAYKVWGYKELHKYTTEWENYTQTTTIDLTGESLYVCYYHDDNVTYSNYGRWSDFWLEVEYPDTTALY